MRVQYPAGSRVSTRSARTRQVVLSGLIGETGRIEDVVDITLGPSRQPQRGAMGAIGFPPLEALIYALAVCCLFYGALRFGQKRFTRKVAFLALVGVTITAFFAFAEYRLVPSMLEASKLIEWKLPLRELPEKWGENMPPDQRALSIIFAKQAYTDYGKLIEYVDKSGSRVRFSPTEKDVENRAQAIAVTSVLDTRNELLSTSWRRWLTTTMATLLFGFVIGRTERPSARAGA